MHGMAWTQVSTTFGRNGRQGKGGQSDSDVGCKDVKSLGVSEECLVVFGAAVRGLSTEQIRGAADGGSRRGRGEGSGRRRSEVDGCRRPSEQESSVKGTARCGHELIESRKK